MSKKDGLTTSLVKKSCILWQEVFIGSKYAGVFRFEQSTLKFPPRSHLGQGGIRKRGAGREGGRGNMSTPLGRNVKLERGLWSSV